MTDDNTREQLTARNFAIRTDQEAMLVQLAKDDDRSVSGALRFILDDWMSLKRAALQAAAPVEAEAVTA
jgi:hypothetical protein